MIGLATTSSTFHFGLYLSFEAPREASSQEITGRETSKPIEEGSNFKSKAPAKGADESYGQGFANARVAKIRL